MGGIGVDDRGGGWELFFMITALSSEDNVSEAAEGLGREVEKLVSVGSRGVRLSAQEREWVRRSFFRSLVVSVSAVLVSAVSAVVAVRAYSSRCGGMRAG